MKKVLYKNRLWVSVLLSLIACFCCFVACNKEERDFIELGAPTEIKIENDKLEWGAIENAESYVIDIDGMEYTTETNNLDVFSIMNEARTYEIKIKAIGNQKDILDAPWSETFCYELKPSDGIEYKLYFGKYYGVYAINPEELQGKLVLPATYNSLPVEAVTNQGFSNCDGLTGVVFPHTVRQLDAFAFEHCSNLKKVDLSCVEVMDSAFFNCAKLEEVIIPETLRVCDISAFGDCYSLEKIHIPRDTEMQNGTGRQGFLGASRWKFAEDSPYKVENDCIIDTRTQTLICGSETSVIPNDVKHIGQSAFRECLLETITIPNAVESIGAYAFTGSKLQCIEIPSSVKEIKRNAFSDCYELKEIKFSEGLESIEMYAFACSEMVDCDTMHIVFPRSLQKIESDAFLCRMHLTSIKLGRLESSYRSLNDTSTVYTDHSYDAGDGWNEVGTGIVYNCTFKEENGEVYVDSFLYVSTKQYSEEISPGYTHNYTIQGSVPARNIKVPRRKGYTFVGWALERDGEIVIGTRAQESAVDGEIVYYTLGLTYLEKIPDNTVLYAVWEKNE